jgi:hypothetical protein
VYQFIRAERAFPRRAPYIDAFRVENQEPAIQAGEVFSKNIKGQLVIRADQDGRIIVRLAHGVQSRINSISHSSDTPAGFPRSENILYFK